MWPTHTAKKTFIFFLYLGLAFLIAYWFKVIVKTRVLNLKACDCIPAGFIDIDYKLHSTGAWLICSHFGVWLWNYPLTPHFVSWISPCLSALTTLIITTPPHTAKAVPARHRASTLIPYCCQCWPPVLAKHQRYLSGSIAAKIMVDMNTLTFCIQYMNISYFLPISLGSSVLLYFSWTFSFPGWWAGGAVIGFG